VRKVIAHTKLNDAIGKIALQRGPIMYCAEWPDNSGRAANIVLPAQTTFTTSYNSNLLNGVMLLNGTATAILTSATEIRTVQQPFVAIPYYAWANRGKGEMMLWFPERIADIDILTEPLPANSK
jgi:DUF1680 family protein